ncbi:phage tail tape measure protein [Clostridium sporogenes]|uniref:phage tail tape measure protein n=2 Tax=Clostridium sporogenes TaxID=1509 RepID=UPI001969FC5F|nr:phage tail tape measure protein [Clostridium sporogenes]MCW6061616.1 phage tail tape measure protein [Clostridium sporogenes]MCW6069808.1 phage tail tape measure protein [Clostridium sporogenes]MCW6122538.1 phage tail tape measure protein [Clostridium sporogenes]
MAGWKTQDMLDGLPPILNLAAAAGEDLGTTSDIVTDALTAFNLKASDAGHFSDILASASSNANTNVSLMGESFKYAAPIFGSVGYSAEDAALSIGLMANSGIKGTQAGTSLRSIITRLVKPTKESSQAMERLGLSITDSNGKMKPFNVLIEDMRRGFAKLNPEQKASVAAQLAGQEAMSGLLSIVNASPADYDKLKGAINNCDGATERMAKTMQDNAKGSVIEMKSALEGASIKIFQAVAPSITSLANSVSNLANKFSNLSPQTQEFLVKMGLVGIALGPVIGTFGRTITLVGKVGEAMLSLGGTLTGTTTAITGVGTAATGAGAAAGTGAVGFGALATAALPIVGIMAAVAGGVYLVGKNTETMNTNCLKSKEELGKLGSVLKDFNGGISISTNQMDNLNIKHKDWSKNVSPETQKALTEVSDKIQSLNLEIQNTNGLDGIITKPQIDSLIKRTDELFKGIQDRINAKVPEAQKKLADVFKADDGKIDKNEQAILDQLNKSHNKNIKELNKYEREIKQIYQRALNEKRDLKKEEMDKIQELTNKAGQIELKATVKNKKELEETKDQFNKRMQHADMEAISKALKEKVKASGEQIKIEKKKYNDQIKVLEENIPKLTGKEREYAEQSLKKLKEDKEKSVRTQQEKYQGYLQEAMKQYPELINFIDTSNGEILNNQQQSDKKKLNEYMKNMEGMAGITKTGYYEIKDTVKNEMHGCYVEVDEKSGEIVGVWDNTTHDVYGNPIKPQSDIAKDLLTGERFQPIKAGYDKKKEAIKKNALEVACNKNYNLFDWVPTLWEGVKSSLSPISVGTGGSIINSAFHYNGLDNVPYDGYIARLHKDERVLTAEENKVYSNNKMGNSEINIIFNEKVDSPAETARRIQNSLREIGFSF